MHLNSHSVWAPTGFLIQATNKPSIFRFANLNPETEFRQQLSRWERVRIGLWFVMQALFK